MGDENIRPWAWRAVQIDGDIELGLPVLVEIDPAGVRLRAVGLLQQGRLSLHLNGERSALQECTGATVGEGNVDDPGTRLVGGLLVLIVGNGSDGGERAATILHAEDERSEIRLGEIGRPCAKSAVLGHGAVEVERDEVGVVVDLGDHGP